MAETTISVTDFRAVSFVFAGIRITGFGDEDSPVTITPKADTFEVVVGADGREMAHSFNAEGLVHDVKIQLIETAAVNRTLMALYIADTQTFNGSGVGTMSYFNPATGERFQGSGRIVRPPELTSGKGVKTREWSLTALMQSMT